MEINESTVRSFKKQYRTKLEELDAQAERGSEEGDPTISKLHWKKEEESYC